MYETILVPVDLSHPEEGSKALGIARQIGGGQARIVALYVAPDMPGFVTAQVPKGLMEKHIADARVELSSRADEAGAEPEVGSGHPPTVILEYAKKIGADLIIIASHRPGLQDYLLGSTAARVVRHAECTVLVDRQNEDVHAVEESMPNGSLSLAEYPAAMVRLPVTQAWLLLDQWRDRENGHD